MSSRIRIVVGFDGSADSWAAARFAAAEAAAETARETRETAAAAACAATGVAATQAAAQVVPGRGLVRLVHSLLDRVAYATLLPPDLTADAEAEARRLLDLAADDLAHAHPGIDVQTMLVQRAPGAALVRISRSADLIVLGRHGHGRAPAGEGSSASMPAPSRRT